MGFDTLNATNVQTVLEIWPAEEKVGDLGACVYFLRRFSTGDPRRICKTSKSRSSVNIGPTDTSFVFATPK